MHDKEREREKERKTDTERKSEKRTNFSAVYGVQVIYLIDRKNCWVIRVTVYVSRCE